MLVLAHADGARLDLDQFRQGVLQAAGDGDGAADRHVEVGKFPGGELGRGIDRGARFVHHHPADIQVGVRAQQVADEPVGLAAGSAVADGDQADAVLAYHSEQRGGRLLDPILWRGREDRSVLQQFPVGIDHRHFHPGAQPRVQPDGYPGAGGRCQQQVLEVVGEDLYRLRLGALPQLAQQIGLQMGQQLDPPGPAYRVAQPPVGRSATILDPPVPGYHRLAGVAVGGLFLRVHHQAEIQYPFIAPAEHREGPV